MPVCVILYVAFVCSLDLNTEVFYYVFLFNETCSLHLTYCGIQSWSSIDDVLLLVYESAEKTTAIQLLSAD